jgi:hypothetical protein
MSCRRAAVALIVLCFVVAGSVARAAEPDSDGFVSLFNGKDLSGWVPVNVATGTDADTFMVKGGLIVCTGVPTGVLRTARMYENFVVELDWRHLRPGGNSGFFVWSDAITSRGVPFTRAVENQVLDGPNHPQRNYTTHGDVFPIHGATMVPGNPGKWGMRSYPVEDRSKPSPEWNHYRIECNNGAISLAVNGKVVTTGKETSPRKGYLCLESEGGLVHFRNLRIKELPPAKDLDPKFVATADEGFKSLYTGINLDGWTTSEQGKAAWQPKDWILHFEPPAMPDPGAPEQFVLRSRREFADGELIVDFRQAPPGPLQLLIGGTPVRIESPAKTKDAKQKDEWHRLRLMLNAAGLTATLDGEALPLNVKLPQNAGPRPIGLNPSTATDFANIYLKAAK